VNTGYAGKGATKNDPDQQCVADMGPIPRGFYAIQPAATHPKLGPVAIRLEPDSSNNMCGRSGFFIYGDKVSDPGNASESCIIMKRTTREAVEGDNDKRLQVVRQSSLSLATQPRRPKPPRAKKRLTMRRSQQGKNGLKKDPSRQSDKKSRCGRPPKHSERSWLQRATSQAHFSNPQPNPQNATSCTTSA
jgi:hypothetical protein